MPRNKIFFEGTKWYFEIRKSKTWERNMFSKERNIISMEEKIINVWGLNIIPRE